MKFIYHKLSYFILTLIFMFALSGCGSSEGAGTKIPDDVMAAKQSLCSNSYIDKPIENSLSRISIDSNNYGVMGIDVTTIESSAAWGVVYIFCDNSIGVVYQKAREVANYDAVSVDIYLARSINGGASWIKSKVATASPPFLNRDGQLEVTQFRNLAMGQMATGEIVVSFHKQVYKYDQSGNKINEPISGNTFTVEGLYSVVSHDWAENFSSPVKLNIPEVINPTTHYKMVPLGQDGIMLSVYGYGSYKFSNSITGVLISTDKGATWDFRKIATFENLPYGETSLLYFKDVLFAQVRNYGDYLTQYYSHDLGKSWSGPTKITTEGQIPGGSFVANDAIILTYGSRIYPYGVGAKISRDNGFTYDETTRVSLVSDSPPIQQGGYANGVESAGGNTYIVFYTMPASPTYKGLWIGSQLKILRFNSRSFYEIFSKPL